MGGVFTFDGGCGNAAEHHLAAQPPVGGNLPRLGDGFVNQRVVMLDVRADSGGSEGGPNRVLHHGEFFVGGHGEGVGVKRHALLQV